MKRYYLCDIIGDGQSESTAFRPAVADHGVTWSGFIPTGPDGRPLNNWALVIVCAQPKDHAKLLADRRINPLADDTALETLRRIGRQLGRDFREERAHFDAQSDE